MFSQKNSSIEQNCQANLPIGIFDSGIGGLSVANAITQLLPSEKMIYYGDTAHLPYGTKPLSLIRTYCQQVAQFLIEEKHCKAVVVACNTASAAAIEQLRLQWPNTPFIGMEPALKPGASQTLTGKVGILATLGTFASKRYAKLTQRFARNIEVWENPCIGLVELIEQGKTDAEETSNLLNEVLQPMLADGVDTFVLGCTHYPFVEPTIRAIVGTDKKIINPAPAIARQLAKVLAQKQCLRRSALLPEHLFFTSGSEETFQIAVSTFFKTSLRQA